MKNEPTIAVFGSSSDPLPTDVERMAELLGAGVAERGWSLITGGYGGVMEVASRGARTARQDARVVGVTLDYFSRKRGGPNRYVNDERPQDGLVGRIGTLMSDADAYVLTWGGIGTLAELFLAWNLVATGWDKPLVAVGPWWGEILDAIQEKTEVKEKARAMLEVVVDAPEALRFLDRRFGS